MFDDEEFQRDQCWQAASQSVLTLDFCAVILKLNYDENKITRKLTEIRIRCEHHSPPPREAKISILF
jgi:hypothetical protein